MTDKNSLKNGLDIAKIFDAIRLTTKSEAILLLAEEGLKKCEYAPTFPNQYLSWNIVKKEKIKNKDE